MGAQARHERLAALLTPLLAEAGLELESIEVTPAGKRRLLRVVVDSDNGVDLDAVGEVSQEISTALDSSDAMGKAPYVLEVTSPGVDRPLTLPATGGARAAGWSAPPRPRAARSRAGSRTPTTTASPWRSTAAIAATAILTCGAQRSRWNSAAKPATTRRTRGGAPWISI